MGMQILYPVVQRELKYCDCYEAGVTLESLPCGGCNFCTCLHHQWARFEDDVDDVVPLAIHRISLEDEEPDWGDILSPDFTPSGVYLLATQLSS